MSGDGKDLRARIIDQIIGVDSGEDCFSFKKELYDLLSEEEKKTTEAILLELASSMWFCRKRLYFIVPLYRSCYGRTLIACSTIKLESVKPILMNYYRKIRKKRRFEEDCGDIFPAISEYNLRELIPEVVEDAEMLLDPTLREKRFGIARSALVTLYRMDKEKALKILDELEALEPRDRFIESVLEEFHDDFWLAIFER